MQLTKVQDPQKRGVILEATATEEYTTGGWTFKEYYGSDNEWYERSTHIQDGRVYWFRLDDSE